MRTVRRGRFNYPKGLFRAPVRLRFRPCYTHFFFPFERTRVNYFLVIVIMCGGLYGEEPRLVFSPMRLGASRIRTRNESEIIFHVHSHVIIIYIMYFGSITTQQKFYLTRVILKYNLKIFIYINKNFYFFKIFKKKKNLINL